MSPSAAGMQRTIQCRFFNNVVASDCSFFHREEHRKREKKNGSSCPFFSSTTTTAEPSKPPSRTQSQSKPPSKSQPQKPARSVSKSHKDFVLPTKTYDGELNSTSHDESDTPAALASSTKGKKKGRSISASRESRASSTAKTFRRKTRSHSQSRDGLRLGDVVEAEEDEEEKEKEPTRRSRRPTTIATSLMTTPGIPKSRSRSISRAKSKAVEEDVLDEEEEAEVVAMPAKTPSRSRLKAKVVRDEEEEAEEEVVELKKSTRGRPKAKAKPKSKVAPPEPEPEQLDFGRGLAVEEEQPAAKIKSKPVTARKPSRTKSKPPPPSPPQFEEEEIEIPAPIPASVKKAGVISSSIAPMRPKADTSKAPSPSSHPLPEISTRVQCIEVETKDRDVMIQKPVAVMEMDEMDAFALTSQSLTSPDQQQTVLAPLDIPKTGGKLKDVNDATNTGINELNSSERSETLKQAKKPAPVHIQSAVQVVTQPLSQASVQEKTKAKGEVLEKDKERKSSIMKVVEISTDEEGDDDGHDNDAMDFDLGLKSEKGRGKVQAEKKNISEGHTKGTEKTTVGTLPPTVSKSTSLNKPVVKEKQQTEAEVVQPAKATTGEKSPRPPTSPSLRFAEPAEDDIEMAEVEVELGSEADHLPHELTQQSETTTDVLPKTPPRRRPSSTKPQLQHQSETLTGPTHPTLTFPALSKLPFTPLENLTDAELDMTVEEWIRYQMGVEFDKFRRDGERELQRWMGRAREARAIIEAL